MKLRERPAEPALHPMAILHPLWICGRCPYLATRLPAGGRCPLCVALMVGCCICGTVVLGEEAHPCVPITETRLGVLPLPTPVEWGACIQ